VRHSGHESKRPAVTTGVVARFAGRGRAASAMLLAAVLTTFAVLATGGLSTACAAPASITSGGSPFATSLTPALSTAVSNSNPPVIRGELLDEYVNATRAHIEAFAENEKHAITWRGEYATSEALLNEGKGVLAGHGEVSQSDSDALTFMSLSFGKAYAANETEIAEIHHLTPDTKYYARFVVESDAPTVSRTFEFTTLPAGPPEVPFGQDQHNGGSSVKQQLATTPTSAEFTAVIQTNGLPTKYEFEYTATPGEPASWAPFSSGASGSVSVAEDFAEPVATLTGLTPETTYYVRVKASNADGEVVENKFQGYVSTEQESFTTPTAKPVVGRPLLRNITVNSVHVNENLKTNGFETSWRYEYATSESAATWSVFASGTISAAHAAAEEYSNVQGTLTGLAPSTKYYVRLFAENANGSNTSPAESFETEGPPTAEAFATHALHGENMRVLGDVNPNSLPTSDEQTITLGGSPTGGTFTLTFDGHTTAPIAFDAPAEGGEASVEYALDALPSAPEVFVLGLTGGPYTVSFYGSAAGVSEPQIEADASGLTPAGSSVTVQTTQAGGGGNNVSYYFQYVPQAQFEATGGEGGFAKAASTPVVEVGSGDGADVVGQDLPGLKPGEAYAYRIVATSSASGVPPVYSSADTLTVPAPVSVSAQPACPNSLERTGPSAKLPDCRAYEQVTPVEKEGSEELFQYGVGPLNEFLIGDNGDHLLFETQVENYGSGPHAGGSPYLFSRGEKGWQLTAGSPQPATGVSDLTPVLFSSDGTQMAFSSAIGTSAEGGDSRYKDIEYGYGPVGGPYVDVASVPRTDLPTSRGKSANEPPETWVGASANFSKLILESPDHSLSGSATGTTSGSDLYEYSAGHLRQVNVGIGSCGARIAQGEEGEAVAGTSGSSPHAVSADGSRIFFEAVPGTVCSEPSHLYMRVNASKTVDIGAYGFFAANAQGTEVLLDRKNGGALEIFLYDTEASAPAPKLLLAAAGLSSGDGGKAVVSEDMSTIYFKTKASLTPEAPPALGTYHNDLYRYDVAQEKLTFVAQTGVEVEKQEAFYVTPDGRYLYYNGAVDGVPGGAGEASAKQAFVYDSVEGVVECVSCASPFDPEPKLESYLGGQPDNTSGRGSTVNGIPELTLISSNGDFAFFDTPAALVPQDIDGEVAPELNAGLNIEFSSQEFSPSSDVYEWRRDGIDGCGQLQGCLALITSGRGGVLNILIGATPSGESVFVGTQAQLAPSDLDQSSDVYDVRVDGGFPPPPPPPVECEGDACSTPPSAPNDPPAALLPPAAPPAEASKSPVGKKALKCTKGKVASHGKCVKRKTKAGRHVRRKAKHAASKRRVK
jgi:hypothetical protein